MGVHKILKQMEKINLENQVKIVTLEKWLIMKSNWRCYRHPLVAPPNLGENLTLLVHHALQQQGAILRSKYHRKQQTKKFPKTRCCEP